MEDRKEELNNLQKMLDSLNAQNISELSHVAEYLVMYQRAEEHLKKRTFDRVASQDLNTMAHLVANHAQCCFCGKWSDEVTKMVAGPSGAYICSECVDRCVKALEEGEAKEPDAP